jgi:hypothetical protein
MTNAIRKEVTDLTKSKFAKITLASMVASLALSGAAMASTADISNTGPDSYNKIEVETSNHVDIDNHNNVTINNNNDQTAITGDAKVSGNTTGGDATSGDAINRNTTSTSVGIDNQSPCACDSVDDGHKDPDHGSTGKGGSSINGGGTAKGGGSETVSSGTLPETGASIPMDVSALRNLLTNSDQAPLAVKASRGLSTALLAIAAVLGLAGAAGSAVYSSKRTLKV